MCSIIEYQLRCGSFSGDTPSGFPLLDTDSKFLRKSFEKNDNLKCCVVEYQEDNVKEDIAILKDFEKITVCEGRKYNHAKVISFVDHKWTRRLSRPEQTSSTCVPIQQAKMASVALLQTYSLNVQKAVSRLLLDRCQSPAIYVYNCNLMPSPNCRSQRAEETSRYFFSEYERHRAHKSDIYLNPDIYDQDWITELMEITNIQKSSSPEITTNSTNCQLQNGQKLSLKKL